MDKRRLKAWHLRLFVVSGCQFHGYGVASRFRKKTAFGSGVTPSVLPGVCVGLIELFLGAGIAASPQNCFRDAGNGQRRRSPNESVSDQWL